MTASRAYAQAAEPGNFFVAGKNILINGDMNIWQRGTSTVMTSTSFGPDRWQSYRGVAGSTVSRQATSDTTNLPFLTYCARVQRDSGNTSTSTIWFVQNIESLLSKPFAGKTATFSFYARAGANYSSASSLLNVRLRWGTGTDQNTLGTWTGGGFAISTTATLTTTWQRFTFTGSVDSTANELSAYVGFDGVGTAGAADYFEITGMQLEIGSVATPFTTATGTLAGELAACQRYYWRQTADNAYSGFGGFGVMFQAAYASIQVPLPVTMRTTPTFARSTVNLYDGAGESAIVTVGANRSTTKTGTIELEAGANWSVIGRPCIMRANNSTAAWVEWSAEL